MARSARYRSYMTGPLWAQRRREYYSRNPRACRSCGGKVGIELHHLTYARLGDERDRDLMPLCVHCHRWPHRLRRWFPVLSLSTCTRLYVHRWLVAIGLGSGGVTAWLVG